MSTNITDSIEQKTKFYHDLIGRKYYESNIGNWGRKIEHLHCEEQTVKNDNGNDIRKYLPCNCDKCKWFIEHEKSKKWREKPCGCESCYYSHLSVDLSMICEFDAIYPGFLFSDVAYNALKTLQEDWYIKVHDDKFILNQKNIENFDAHMEKFTYKDQIIDGLTGLNDEMIKNVDFMESNIPSLDRIKGILRDLTPDYNNKLKCNLQTTVVNEMLAYKELNEILKKKLEKYVYKKETQEIDDLKTEQNKIIQQDLKGLVQKN